jgi:hypothetical protein
LSSIDESKGPQYNGRQYIILRSDLFVIRYLLDHPDADTARTLMLIAKVVQKLANLSSFKPEEGYMMTMNELLDQNLKNLKNFIDSISVSSHITEIIILKNDIAEDTRQSTSQS